MTAIAALMHSIARQKILLNYVLLSPIVSGGVRTSLPGQTPLVCCRSWVGWDQNPASWVGWGQEYGLVSVFYKNTRRVLSYDVLQQQKTGVMTKGVVSGGSLTSSPAYNVEPVTNTSSSSCANNGRRTPRCARRSPPSVSALLFTVRDSYD